MDCSLGTNESTVPTSEDMMPSLPVPPPEPVIVHCQAATCGWGTRSHPYFIGDHFSYTHRVLEGAGCHRRDRGHRIVASRFPNGHPSDAGDSNASSSACSRRHSGVVRAQSPDFQGTQELTVLAIVLRQRHEQWMEGLGQAFPGARDLLEEKGLDLVSMLGVENPNK